MPPFKTLSEQLKEIELLIRYGAPARLLDQALVLAKKYENDHIALRVFHNFYSYLPADEEEALLQLDLINTRQGLFLIRAVSESNGYLYLVSTEEAALVGTSTEGIAEEEILDFFGWRDNEALLAALQKGKFAVYQGAALDGEHCPACLVSSGEFHILGCPVEICPWCGGQLVHCNCRFTVLQKARFDRDSDLDELYRQLTEKGRIAFEPESQAPTYFSLSEQLRKNRTEQ